MTMKKKVLTTLSVVLILGMAAMGILAYLTSQDSDVNVMTLGNVEITQYEYQRAENADGTYKTDSIDNQTSYVLEFFKQDKALLPATDPSNNGAGPWDTTTVKMSQVGSYGEMQVFENSNAQDKFVVVENTGKTDAYVRTLVAIEVGSTDGSLLGASYHKNWTQNYVGTVEIAENNYDVLEYVYKGASDVSRHENGILPAGETAYPSLSQVYISSKATNEDMVALDGNDNGKLDILVISQAVQAQGFEDAVTALDAGFGKVTEVKAKGWFEEILGNPVAKVTVLDKNDTIENANKTTILDKNLKIDTTDSKMGIALEEKISLDTAYQFEPTMTLDEGSKSEYADWHADFVVSVDKDIPAYGIGLAGYYDLWCSLNNNKWVMLASDAEIPAGTEIRLVDAMGGGSITVSYEELCRYGNDGIGFLCGAVDLSGQDVYGQTVGQIPAGTTITVELRLYEATGSSRSTETGEFITTGVYKYTFK